ncbi:MAG TPA: GNAT family N-acetyltransferase [Symbiobacteriaceae bacterium]|nr:GNAT family N-acetyltransferase [Symbiobacteriaceae bacterium]
MEFLLRPMRREDAVLVAAWHYDGPYSFYDMDQDPEDLAELLDGRSWERKYRSVVDETGALVGFFCFDPDGSTVEIGLGLRPDLTGQGLGRPFLEAGLASARAEHRPDRFRLSVAAFNQRAVRLYEQAGFSAVREYTQTTNGGEYPFVMMEKPV